MFYQRAENSYQSKMSLTVYDGDTFHILLDEGVYEKLLKSNKNALNELCEKLTSKCSLKFYLKNIVRTLFWSMILLIPFIFTFKVLSYGLPLEEQESLLSLYYTFIALFFVGHLLRILISLKYRDDRYGDILEYIEDNQFRREYVNFKREYGLYYTAFNNPYKKVFLKLLTRLAFYCLVVVLFISYLTGISETSFSSSIVDSFSNTIETLNTWLLPSKSETSYHLTETEDISFLDGDRVMFYGDYIIGYNANEETRVYDLDLNLLLDFNSMTNVEGASIASIKGDYLLVNMLLKNEDTRVIRLYDLKTKNILHEIDIYDIPFYNVDELFSTDFAYSRGVFYVGVSFQNDVSFINEYKSFNGIIVINDSSLTFHETNQNYIVDIEYLNNKLYYIMDTGYLETESYIYSSDLECNEFTRVNHKFNNAKKLTVYEDYFFFYTSSIGQELVRFDEDFKFKSINVGMISYNSSPQNENILISGTGTFDFLEIDIDGNKINSGLIYDYQGDRLSFYKTGNQLLVIENYTTLHQFEETDEPIIYYQSHFDVDEFLTYNQINLDTFTNILILCASLVIIAPYLATILNYSNKVRNLEFFEKFRNQKISQRF
jgi:hypothetical protein